jgi:hypothetical protein
MNISEETAGAGPHVRMGTWPLGQRSLARIAELRALCQDMARRPNTLPNAEVLAEKALHHLNWASKAANQKRTPWTRSGALIETIETNIHSAVCLMLRYMPLEQMEAWLPELIATIREHLPEKDPRRVLVEELVRSDTPPRILAEAKRESIVTAFQAALRAQGREHARVRSFRNIVYGVTAGLTLLALTLGTLMALKPGLMPICFQPGKMIVCPTSSKPYTEQQDSDAMFRELAKGSDYFVIELVGLIAAAVAAAASLRQLRGTAIPYSIPLALALLKLPTGALTAVLGLLLMRGDFIPGLSALDTSAQIVAWAVVFGYAQQLFTRLVDERGQTILNAVGGAENATLMDQRMSSTLRRKALTEGQTVNP